MVGNDVIDLGDPETRAGSCHARFDARVFDDDERALLLASADPTRRRWVLWAAKEAAFKVARKLDGATVFSPRRFVVRPGDDGHAVVRPGDDGHAVVRPGAVGSVVVRLGAVGHVVVQHGAQLSS